MEASYGPRVDTATELRAVSMLGLVRTNYPDVGVELVRLLGGPRARGADRRDSRDCILGNTGGSVAAALEDAAGRPRTRSAGRMFHGAVVPGADAVARIRGGLSRTTTTPAIAEGAALALGESRREEAFEILKAHVDSPIRPAVLLAIALLRKEAAIEYLLARISDRDVRAALDIYKDDPGMQEKIRMAASKPDECE